jgi:hypothetical protein
MSRWKSFQSSGSKAWSLDHLTDGVKTFRGCRGELSEEELADEGA